MSLDSARRFSQRADYYSRYRPGYPPEVIGILAREIGFSARSIVADIASGTGLLTRLFLANGNHVFGVEPSDRMRAHAERDLSTFGSFVSVRGTAERTTLKGRSVDLITVGQALHWFDSPKAIKEFSRISKPGGSLCVVYNERRNDRFGRAYGALIKKHKMKGADVPNAGARCISCFFRDGKCSRFEVPNEQSLGFQGLLGRLLSASYMPSPSGSKSHAGLRRDVKDLFERFSSEGKVRLRYRSVLYVGRVA